MSYRKKETRGTLTDADAARSSSMRTCFDSSQNSMQIRGNSALELHITFI